MTDLQQRVSACISHLSATNSTMEQHLAAAIMGCAAMAIPELCDSNSDDKDMAATAVLAMAALAGIETATLHSTTLTKWSNCVRCLVGGEYQMAANIAFSWVATTVKVDLKEPLANAKQIDAEVREM